MTRLQLIDPAQYPKLDPDDRCWHIGEYTVGGGFQAGETNDQISNLKKTPPVPDNQIRWKLAAIRYWGDKLAQVLNLDAVLSSVTLVPAPCSKPLGHPNYDNRMEAVLARLAVHRPGIDIRPLVTTRAAREPQHSGGRLATSQLAETMTVNPLLLATPLKPHVLIVDDVFTQGGTFKAIQHLLAPYAPKASGVFLAKAIWPNPFEQI